MNTQNIDKLENVENEVLSFISEKSRSVIDTLSIIEKHGYTKSEAEDILKNIYTKHSPPKDTVF